MSVSLNKIYRRFLCLSLIALKPGLHVQRKHKHMHKHVYMCDKHNATYASAEAYNSGESWIQHGGRAIRRVLAARSFIEEKEETPGNRRETKESVGKVLTLTAIVI